MINLELYSRYESAFGFVARNAIDKAETAWAKKNMSLYTSGDSTFADVTFVKADGTKYVFSNPEPATRANGIVSAISKSFSPASAFGNVDGVIAPPPIVSFSRTKNITKTVIDNSDYEVIENFGLKSWSIKVEGIVVDMDNHWYPSDFEAAINEMFEVNEVLEVVGDVFSNKKINSIYFDSVDLSPVEGYNDTVKFALQAYSIKPVEFFSK